MGGGSWSGSGRAYYSSVSTLASSTDNVRDVFRSSHIQSQLSPDGVMLRESCDSEDNPNSNAIILALDVTGSMGSIAHKIAKDGLGELCEGILERLPLEDPHIMFMAVGDAACDSAPLQVSQFEADHRIVEQLQQIYVEGGGGGNQTESYDLPWYFAGTRTNIDCFDKRERKGYLFTMGDELPPDGLTASQRKRVFGTDDQRSDIVTAANSLEMAQERFNVFHLVIEQGSFCRGHHNSELTSAQYVHGQWSQLMGKRAIRLDNYNYLSQVVLSIIDVSEGKNPQDVINSWENADIQKTVAYALDLM